MRSAVIASTVFLVAQGAFVSPGFAQGTSEAERLLTIIKDQQRRIEAQEAQLAEQKKALLQLRKEVDALQGGGRPVTAPATASAGENAGASHPGVESAKSEKASYPGVEGGSSAPSVAQKEEWPGSFGLKGSDTRIKIGGFVELDAMHDNRAILTPSAFVTQAIVTRNATNAQGADGKTSFSVQASRLVVESRTPLQDKRLSTFLSVDFFDDFGSTANKLRLRQAYGEVTNALFGGDLMFGQAWSTFTNLYSIPNVLEFQSVNSLYGTRHPMIRWTKGIGQGLQLKLAAEAPDVRSFEGASPSSRWPDGVVALNWGGDAFNLQGSLLARDLRASSDNGPVASAFGWGASLAGRVSMTGALKNDFANFSLTHGEGIGGVLNDVPPDASYNPLTNDLEPIPVTAWYAAYQHWWNPKFYSVLSYGEVRQSNLGFQAPTAYRKTQYATANVTWTPYANWLLGVEAVYGSREDKDGAKGSVLRTLFTTRFSF